MSTVRIQVRRGVSTGSGSWFSVNPTLAAGEIGLETDTGSFKFGDGSTAWNSLGYALADTLGDYIPLSQKGVASGIASLDSSGFIPTAQLPPLAKVTVSSVANQAARLALTAEVGDIAIQADSGASYILQTTGASTDANWKELVGNEKVQDVIGAMLSGNTATGVVVTYQDSDGTIDFEVTDQFSTRSTTNLSEGTNLYHTTERAQDAVGEAVGTGLSYNDTTGAISVDTATIQARVANITDTEIGYLDGVTSAIQTQIDAKASLSGATFTGAVSGTTMTLSGDLTVNGTTTIINSTAVNVNNQVIFEGATPNEFETTLTTVEPTADRSISLPDATGTIVLADNTQTLSNKSINLNANTITTTLAQLNTAVSDADLVTLSGLETLTGKTLTSPKINEDVSLGATSTELNILDGATLSTAELNILDGVTASTAELNVLDGITSSTAELNILDGVTSTAAELNILDGVTSSTAELNILDGVTATAAQINVLTSLTSSATELNILDGVTATTAELNKLAGVTATSAEINTLAGITSTAAELNILDGATLSVTELNYVDGVTSAIQTQLNNKQEVVANVSDTEIGYLDGVTSAIQTQLNGKQATVLNVSDVEIGYLDGVTSAIQTQLNNKQAIVANVSDIEIGYLDGVTSAIQTQINTKLSSATASSTYAYLASPALTGTPTAPLAATGTNTTQIATTSFVQQELAVLTTGAPAALNTLDELAAALGDDANYAATITTALGNKAPLASPTFTGTVTLPAAGIVFTDGTQAKEGVPSRTPIIQKTDSYTLSALTERDSLIEVSKATATTISIPTDATLNFPIGTSIDILQTGAGQVTIAAVTPGTTTVNATPGLKLRTTWSSATLFKRAANTWVVFGDLTA